MKFAVLALALALPAIPFVGAHAQDAGPPAEKVRTVTVFGSDACPPASGSNEIVVCARRPESDRYRIPKALRAKKPRDADGAWGNTVAMLDDIGRTQMTPNSCSPNGANGQTGCTMKMQQQWYQARKAQKAEEAAESEAEASIPPQP